MRASRGYMACLIDKIFPSSGANLHQSHFLLFTVLLQPGQGVEPTFGEKSVTLAVEYPATYGKGDNKWLGPSYFIGCNIIIPPNTALLPNFFQTISQKSTQNF